MEKNEAMEKALVAVFIKEVEERFLDIARDGYTVEDAVADVLEDRYGEYFQLRQYFKGIGILK